MTLVKEFHDAFGHPAPDRATVPDHDARELRVRLILEEAAEVIGALYNAPDIDTEALAYDFEKDVAFFVDCLEDDHPTRDLSPRMADVAKELADLRYVTDGAGVAFGFPVEEVFRLVHEGNMSKRTEQSGDEPTLGKVAKGPNYVPPEPAIRKLLGFDPVAKATGENSGW